MTALSQVTEARSSEQSFLSCTEVQHSTSFRHNTQKGAVSWMFALSKALHGSRSTTELCRSGISSSRKSSREATEGGFLELVNKFEVAGGSAVYPHQHPTHEFYYMMSGRGIMTIGDENREVQQGDLVYIPPDAVHSLRPTSDNAPIHCFCFAIGVAGIGKIDYSTHD